MRESPSSETVIRGSSFFDSEVARLMLLGSGLVSESVLVEAIQESQRNPQLSLWTILMESGKISQADREQLERFSRDIAGWAPGAGLSLGSTPAANGPVKSSTQSFRPGESTSPGFSTLQGAGSNFQTFVNPVQIPAESSAEISAFVTGPSPGSGRSPVQSLAPPSSLTGPTARIRYQKVSLYRYGGLAQIWVGKDQELDRTVAVKEILPNRADDPDARELFETEARMTASLEHPSIIPIYGKGRHADGRPYYAMRFVTGTTYQEEIERWHHSQKGEHAADRSLSFRKLLLHLLDVCNAVHYAHCNGILHLDLKPQNVMKGEFGETFVLDWGLSRKFDKSAPAHPALASSPRSGSLNSGTVIGSIPGTPHYMSPEQAQGRSDRLGPHTDVYSLGATLYHLLVGQPPRSDAKTTDEAWQLARNGIFQPPRSLRSDIDRDLNAICLKAMAYEIADRYASADEFRRDLERWLAKENVAARPLKPWHPEQVWRLVKRHSYIAVGLALLFPVLGLAAAIVTRNSAIQSEQQKMKGRIDEVLEKATSDDPSMTTVLEVLLKYYQDASSDHDSDNATIAKNLERSAKICERIATMDEAIQYQTDAIEHYDRVLRDHHFLQQDFGKSVNAKKELCRMFLEKGDLQQATIRLTDLLTELQKQPRERDAQLVQAQVLQNLARAFYGKNELKESASKLESSERLLSLLNRDADLATEKSRECQGFLADNFGLYGDVKLAQGNATMAEKAYNESRRLRQQLLARVPQDGKVAIRCAWAADNFLRLARRKEDNGGQLRTALEKWEQDAHKLRLELYESKSNNREYRRELAWSCLFRGEVLMQLARIEHPPVGQLEPAQQRESGAAPEQSAARAEQAAHWQRKARKDLIRCFELSQQSTDEDISHAESRSHRAYSAINLAYLYFFENNRADAQDKLDDAEGFLQDLNVDDGIAVYYKSALRLALLAAMAPKPERAESLRKQAAEKVKGALQHLTSGERPREWELDMLRDLPGMKEIVDKLEASAAGEN